MSSLHGPFVLLIHNETMLYFFCSGASQKGKIIENEIKRSR